MGILDASTAELEHKELEICDRKVHCWKIRLLGRAYWWYYCGKTGKNRLYCDDNCMVNAHDKLKKKHTAYVKKTQSVYKRKGRQMQQVLKENEELKENIVKLKLKIRALEQNVNNENNKNKSKFKKKGKAKVKELTFKNDEQDDNNHIWSPSPDP